MDFLADFHIHSRYSRATSKSLSLESLQKGALLKGITVLGTGDFTHPAWTEEIREKLVSAEDGLFRLRDDLTREVGREVPSSCSGQVRFLLTTEISSIYKKDGKVRKVHNLIFAPTLDTATEITARLERIGNIASDGRPILGLDSRDLLEIVLETGSQAFLVPAHIWTPWFSVLGSKSGFDSIEACFDDLSSEIFSVETGLSSDPAMNWRVSFLDRYSLISNSDAHSAEKVGREANRFSCDLSYHDIKEALRHGREKGFLGTVEFFPEQGKYHLDGHRKCSSRLHPKDTLKEEGKCPVCGKGVTVGVMHRVEELADRSEGEQPERALPYDRLISLAEVVGDAKGSGPQTKGVQRIVQYLLQRLGPEYPILTAVPLDEIRGEGGSLLAEGIRRMRQAEVILEPGYDGEFGVVKLFQPGEREEKGGQLALVGLDPPKVSRVKKGKAGARKKKEKKADQVKATPAKGPEDDVAGTVADRVGLAVPGENVEASVTRPRSEDASDRGLADGFGALPAEPASLRAAFPSEDISAWATKLLGGLNPEQKRAVLFSGAPLLMIAGPGTGKTHTLTCRIAYMIKVVGKAAGRVLAVTFTQRAAREMEERLRTLLGISEGPVPVRVRTFHALGAELLREAGPECGIPRDFFILSNQESLRIVKQALPALSHKDAENLLEKISLAKRNLLYPEDGEQGFEDREFHGQYGEYQRILGEYRALDYDDLVALPVRTLRRFPEFGEKVRTKIGVISVDEYQDVNSAQYHFLRLLAANVRDICVIGDPDQAIYGFRGASPRFFQQFEKDYPDGRVIRLVRNYRSTGTILSASTAMLSTGLGEAAREPGLVPVVKGGRRICEVELASEKSEAIFVAQTIEHLIGGTNSLWLYADKDSGEQVPECSGFGDIAVLYRLNALAPGLEKALDYQGIPCQGASQADRWQGREGRTLLALLRWMRNPEDRLALEEIQTGLNKPPEELIPLMEAYCQRQRDLGQRQDGVRHWVLGLQELDWIPLQEKGWKETWEMLVRGAVAFGRDWETLLSNLTLSRPQDLMDRKLERVTLASLHAAKGLEFPVVFIVGCEDQLLPCRIGVNEVDLEEERRLFYVGMTRACRLLYLTHARSRFLYGERMTPAPSPFLRDTPKDKIERLTGFRGTDKRKKAQGQQPLLFKLPAE